MSGVLCRVDSAILVVALLAALTVPSPAEAGATSDAKVDPDVQVDLQTAGKADVIVYFAESADLGPASQIDDWDLRGEAVVAALQATARDSQAETIARLQAEGVDHEVLWIANAIHVPSADRSAVTQMARDPEVVMIDENNEVPVPEPSSGTQQARINSVEWGISAIGADVVWANFANRGEGIVVGSIDTGVRFDHPALVAQYRGTLAGGAFDHNHNWFDPARACGSPSIAPCDNNNHGTHTVGTMVGDDGAGNQIGVAPRARWIAAKGCESNSCSDSSLMASGQWMLAPTRLDGSGADASKRPHIINNSWGGMGEAPFFDATIDAWRASGIFPAFSNGNSGPSCNTDGSPGNYSGSYAAGAFDRSGTIASFSSRGPGRSGEVKPNIAAPGVDVRSAISNGGYVTLQGTSMASPHVAGTVALMWALAPSLMGDVAATRSALDATAVDVENLTCGGTVQDNNVYGEGRLNALAAVTATAEAVGRYEGVVLDGVDATPIGGATVTITGATSRTVATSGDGSFELHLLPGSHTVEVSAFGYSSTTTSAEIVADQTTTAEIPMAPIPRNDVQGLVRGGSETLAGATLTLLDQPVPPVTSGPNGAFTFPDIPYGTYSMRASFPLCYQSVTTTVTVGVVPSLVEFTLPATTDAFGYTCSVGTAAYVEGDTPLTLTGDDTSIAVPLPFPVPFYGTAYSNAHMASNGHLNFLASSTAFTNTSLPSTAQPNAAVYPLWDDLVLDASSATASGLVGLPGDRRFLLEWRNARFFDNGSRLDFSVELWENGIIELRYRNTGASGRTMGSSATIGIENAAGTVALPLSVNRASLMDGRSLRFTPPNLRTTPTISGVASPDVVIGGQVSDAATVTGRQNAQSGATIEFSLYGPGDDDCSGTPAFSEVVAQPVGEGAVSSGQFTPALTGVYRWVATYSGDALNNPVSTSCGDEEQRVEVTPRPTPTLTAQASPDVILGGQLTDTATVSGRQNAQPGSTLIFRLYGPDDTTCAGTPAFTDTKTLPLTDGDVTSASFTPASTGTYRWRVSYSGDASNNPVATDCEDPAQEVQVTPLATPTMTGQASPGVVIGGQLTDTATISGRHDAQPGATLVFRLYGPDDSNCAGTPAFSDTKTMPVADGPITSDPFTPASTGTYRWRAFYSGDAHNNPVATDCADPDQQVEVTSSPPAETCFGQAATIVGTPGDDVLQGTPGVDVIVGLGGDDTIYGRSGADLICGGDGHDYIDSGGSIDHVDGGPGDDAIMGGHGDDVLMGGPGADRIQGGGHDDLAHGGEGDDSLIGSWGDDEMYGGEGDDRLYGAPGDDSLFGEAGDDAFDGGTGQDNCDGGPHDQGDQHTRDCEVLTDIP